MADTHEFWSHGVTVVPQQTPHLTGHDNGLFMMPLSWGTVVRQNGGTTNWFHIPISTPVIVDDWTPYAQHAYVKIRLAPDAHIDVLTVRETTTLGSSRTISHHDLFGHQREFDNGYKQLINQKVSGPLCISFSARFEGNGPAEDRDILFAGAGVAFEEKR